MPLGLYLSVPFCRTKCSYCNFASDVFSRTMFQRYVDRVNFDLDHAAETALNLGGIFESSIDSIFLGGGTPTVLEPCQFVALFQGIARNFQIQPGAELTVECAPGTLSAGLLEAFQKCGINRVSLGVQSFVDKEAASVGRIHKESTVADDIARLRDSGISNINVDLIAGLPHQTAESWQHSVDQAIASEVPHVSVYMLEVDEDSRLGREVLAGGTKYHAHFVPDDDLTADLYITACEKLNASGIKQYEISNFAREGFESRHNLKYWTRQPYMGFGVDAHSMLYAAGAKALLDDDPVVGLKAHASTALHAADLRAETGVFESENEGIATDAKTTVKGPGLSLAVSAREVPGLSPSSLEAIRFAGSDLLDAYLRAEPFSVTPVPREAALEEIFFLGLRLNRGVDLNPIQQLFGEDNLTSHAAAIMELKREGLLEQSGNVIHLTSRGRLLSNEAFERFIEPARMLNPL